MSDWVHETASARRIPRLSEWDSTLALIADPYRFIGKRCPAIGSRVFEARFLLQPTICMSGVQEAELFYDTQRFQRHGAAPEPVQATLFGKGGVQGLDGTEHRQRKALFMAATAPHSMADLRDIVRDEWLRSLVAWSSAGPFSLYRAVQPVLARAACRWAGVPLPKADVPLRTWQLTALFDAAASGPAAHICSRTARMRAEAWLTAILKATRSGHAALPPGSPAHAVAWHRNDNGTLLPPRIAAVELLNLLRPTVAVSVYIAFVAHALRIHSEWAAVLADEHANEQALAFAEEVRRHYPFFPAVVARVREDFEWHGLHFARGRRVMLDLYGTNHDSRAWDDPQAFRPQRWHGVRPSIFAFVPQGGGDAATNHRCPGEDLAVQIMLLSIDVLLRRMRYEVPVQDLDIAMSRLPAIPRQGFVIHKVMPLS
jgi:fatty-acid peroxygenase